MTKFFSTFTKALQQQAKKVFHASHLNRRQALIDAFDDDIARQTQWRPLFRNTNRLLTRIEKISITRIELRATKQTLIAAITVSLIGLLILLLGFHQWINLGEKPPSHGAHSGLFFVGIALTAVGYYFKQRASKIMYFDHGTATFGRQLFSIFTSPNKQAYKEYLLGNVHALQLLVIDSAQRGRAQSPLLQLNLVLSDASRQNIVSSHNKDEVKAIADELKVFLNLPLWQL